MHIYKRESVEQRFWKFVSKTGDATSCWNWTGPKHKNGYGYLSHWPIRGKKTLTHRLSWLLHFGDTPPEHLCVCHRCDNRSCVRPDHLFLGTMKQNIRDAVEKGRFIRGARAPKAKLNESQVKAIRTLYPGRSQQSLATEYGISQCAVSAIICGKSWGWLP